MGNFLRTIIELVSKENEISDENQGCLRRNLVSEAERLEEDSVFSSKGHYAAADYWRNTHLIVGIPTAILTGLAGVVILAGNGEVLGISISLVFGLVALAGAVSTAIMTFLSPQEKSTKHQAAGDNYNSLKGRARRFYDIDIYRTSYNLEQLAERLELLIEKRDELNQASPLIPERAYKKAKKGIEEGQASYETDQFRGS